MKKLIVGFFFFFSVLATSWTLLRPGFFRVHDYVHATRIVEVYRAASEGHFPVRWSANLGYGYGMPLFEFYAPLPYYVGAFFYWIGLDVVTAIKLLYLVCSAGTFLGMYLFGSKMLGRTGGVLAAVALTLAPYRAVNLYVRGALSEAWAIMALPWVLYGISRVIKKEQNGWVILVLSLVALYLSHNITTMIFVPISGIFALAYLMMEYKGKLKDAVWPLLQLAGSYVLSIGLGAFYIFPALTENKFTKVQSIFGGYFHYSHHFLYIRQFFYPNWKYGGSSWGPDDDISFFFGWGQIVGVFLTAILVLNFIYYLWQKKAKQKIGFKDFVMSLFAQRSVQMVMTFGVIFCISVYMTLLKSKPIWDAIPFFTFIQFPWRWLSVVSLSLAMLVASGVYFIRLKFARFFYAYFLIAVLLINFMYFRPEKFLDNPDDIYFTDTDRIQRNMSGILPDYIPVQMSDQLVPPASLFLVPGGTEQQVEVLVNKGHQKLFRTRFISEVFLNFMIADFPGWKVEIDGKELSEEQKRAGQNGTFGVNVPAGEHLVGVYFGSTPVRFWSDTASAVSFLIFLVLIIDPKERIEKRYSYEKN